eukprot:740619_1
MFTLHGRMPRAVAFLDNPKYYKGCIVMNRLSYDNNKYIVNTYAIHRMYSGLYRYDIDNGKVTNMHEFKESFTPEQYGLFVPESSDILYLFDNKSFCVFDLITKEINCLFENEMLYEFKHGTMCYQSTSSPLIHILTSKYDYKTIDINQKCIIQHQSLPLNQHICDPKFVWVQAKDQVMIFGSNDNNDIWVFNAELNEWILQRYTMPHVVKSSQYDVILAVDAYVLFVFYNYPRQKKPKRIK